MSLQDHDDLLSSMTFFSYPPLLSMGEAYKEYLERKVAFTGCLKEAQAKLEQLKVSHPELFV